MTKSSHLFTYYCDLEIATIKIHSTKEIDFKMVRTIDKYNPSLPIIDLILWSENDCIIANFHKYREKIMQTGYYVGHHFGKPVFMNFLSDSKILLRCENPEKIIWCYVIKIVLTSVAHKRRMLHIKGSSFEYKGKAFLVLGRGGSGKTELLREMCKEGARLMGNTHVIIDGWKAIGVKSNIRIREFNSERYLNIDMQKEMPLYDGWADIGALLWVQYRSDGKNLIDKLNSHVLYHNMRWFSEAVGNWELKEDIADSVESDPVLFARYMEELDNLVKQLSITQSAYYLNLDVRSYEGKRKVIDLLDRFS